MTNFLSSITQDDCFTALRAFLLAVVPVGTEVFVSQRNRVPEPFGGNFISMTEMRQDRLRTTIENWDFAAVNPNFESYTQGAQITYQLDVHGSVGSDNSKTISTLWKSSFAADFMRASGYPVAPLWCDDGNQMSFINGEKQYEDRWVVNLTMQVNPVISAPQQFADTITTGIIEVD